MGMFVYVTQEVAESYGFQQIGKDDKRPEDSFSAHQRVCKSNRSENAHDGRYQPFAWSEEGCESVGCSCSGRYCFLNDLKNVIRPAR